MNGSASAHRFLVVVAYDVVSDRRRARVYRKLLAFGEPVQYSVFECVLDAEGLRRLQRVVAREISPGSDRVRYYVLCGGCRRRIQVVNGEVMKSWRTVVV